MTLGLVLELYHGELNNNNNNKMSKIKTIYQYIYYKLYRFYEKAPNVWWSEWKASLTLDILLFFIVLSLYIYYEININPYINLASSNIYSTVVIIIISIANYCIFQSKDQWKEIVRKFDKLPPQKNKIGTWMVFGCVTLIVFNLILAYYLMSQIDWSLYR